MSTSQQYVENNRLDVLRLLRVLWSGRWLIVACAITCGALGATYAWYAPKWWRAEVVLVQTDNKSLPSGLSQLSGLASLTGINLMDGSNSRTPLAVLRSREFLRQFIKDRNLIPVLFADRWDAAAVRWKVDRSDTEPDMRDAVRMFDDDIRRVTEDSKSGLVTLSITWRDPKIAAEWANELVERVNERLRTEAIRDAEQSIKYLREQIADSTVPSLQQSVSRVLESEMQKLLLARGREEYAFRVVDPAVPPKLRARPRRTMIVLTALLFGALVSGMVVVLRVAFKSTPAGR